MASHATPSQNQSSDSAVNRLIARSYTLNWEMIAYVVIFLLAIFTRFYVLGERAMSHDESLHTRYSYNLAADGNFQHTPLMHGPILFHFTALFYLIFGDNDFTSRIYAAVLGIAVVMMPVLFRRWLGRWGALLASIMLLISPITMYYHRYIREDTPNIFYAFVMVYAIFVYLSGSESQRRQEHWLYVLSGAMLMCLGSKETAFIYIAIFGLFLALYWFVRLAQHYRQIPGKTVFYSLIMAICLGGVAALGMYVTLSISLGEREFSTLFATGEFINFITFSLLVVFFLAVIVSMTLQFAFRGSVKRLSVLEGTLFTLLTVGFSILFIYLEELSRLSHEVAGLSAPVVPTDATADVVVNGISRLPFVGVWALALIVLAVLYVLTRQKLIEQLVEQFPELDLIVVIATLVLPWASPVIVAATGASPVDYSTQGMIYSLIALAPLYLMSSAVGLLWNWRKWLICNAIFYALFFFFFTTMFTNLNGVATGLVGSLGYWLEQQGVRRGNQPQYYYLTIIIPLYEYLPMIGSFFAMVAGLFGFWRFRRQQLELSIVASTDEGAEGTNKPALRPDQLLTQLPFLPFVAWWAVFNLIGYTLAGEKMPWLTTHLALPMILLTAWYFGRVFEQIEWERFTHLGWIVAVLTPLLLVLIARLVAPLIFAELSFTNLSRPSLQILGQWLAVWVMLAGVIYVFWWVNGQVGTKHLRHMFAIGAFAFLSILTLRVAWIASFINYDLANEYLVYAHSAVAVKDVLSELEDLSRRTTDGLELQFIYDNEVSWPYSWYFRHFKNAVFVGASPNAQQVDTAMAVVVGEANRAKIEPLLEDRFYHREYIRLWWPMQDYFNLTPTRLSEMFGFTSRGIQVRRGVWDIWWSRDYSTYGTAVGRDFSLARWPVSDRMHLYIRKDFASQVWDLGVGDGVVENPLDEVVTNSCNSNWQSLFAELVIDSNTSGITMNHPIGVAVEPNGTILVAEEFGHRLTRFDQNGALIEHIGQPGRVYDPSGNFLGHETTVGLFERPGGLTVDQVGNIYVADTWNFRVQILGQDGGYINAWGQRGEYGASAQTLPTDGFWGPRDVQIDASGNVYIADTGNKRVRVYASDGTHIRDIGSAGSAEGQLNEPSGLAIHPDGLLFVADTWNRRVSVFDLNGDYQYDFKVRAWFTDLGNRPYLAIDETRERLYVTDPDAGRVLVYDLEGNCLGSFGQAGSADSPLGSHQIVVATGITVDADGKVYVADAGGNRILRFAPYDWATPILEEPLSEAVGQEPLGQE